MKGAIYYVAIATVIFSRVKMSSFRTKAHLVFHWSLYNKKFFLTIKTDNVTSSRREMDPHRQ